jgi:hypothetical protein
VTLRGVLELLARREAKSNCLQKGLSTHRESWNCSQKWRQRVILTGSPGVVTKVRQRVTVYKRDLVLTGSPECSQKWRQRVTVYKRD